MSCNHGWFPLPGLLASFFVTVNFFLDALILGKKNHCKSWWTFHPRNSDGILDRGRGEEAI
eukprot:3548571-Prorocentrum_lima.AAC.1